MKVFISYKTPIAVDNNVLQCNEYTQCHTYVYITYYQYISIK